MKFNWRNIPLVYCEDIPNDEGWQRCNQKDMEKLSNWIEGFERKLRDFDINKWLIEYFKTNKTIPSTAQIIRDFINDEVLGETTATETQT